MNEEQSRIDLDITCLLKINYINYQSNLFKTRTSILKENVWPIVFQLIKTINCMIVNLWYWVKYIAWIILIREALEARVIC